MPPGLYLSLSLWMSLAQSSNEPHIFPLGFVVFQKGKGMFNPFRKKIKVPEGVALTSAQSITQKYIDAYVAGAEAKPLFRHGTEENVVIVFPGPPDNTLADAVPYSYYLHASHKLTEANKCQYCRSLFVADRRGNCRSCGAPK